jgi:hypothetical protein
MFKLEGMEQWPIPTIWSDFNRQKDITLSGLPSYSIKIHNLGSGPAKDVSIFWKYNAEKLMNKYNNPESDVQLSINNNNQPELKMKNIFTPLSKEKNHFFNFILPYHCNINYKVQIPSFILHLVGLIYYEEKKKDFIVKVDIESLNFDTEIIIKYTDMQDNSYIKSYHATFRFLLLNNKNNYPKAINGDDLIIDDNHLIGEIAIRKSRTFSKLVNKLLKRFL